MLLVAAGRPDGVSLVESQPQFPLLGQCQWSNIEGGARSVCVQSSPAPGVYVVCDWRTLAPNNWQTRCYQMSTVYHNAAYFCDVQRFGEVTTWRCRDLYRSWVW